MLSPSTESGAAVLNREPSRAVGMAASAASGAAVRVVRGRRAVLAMQGMLHELGERTNQADATRWFGHFMSSPEALTKTPYLFLVGSGAAARLVPRADDVWGAVLVYEYLWNGWGTGVFATDNVAGARTVIAPEDARIDVAAAALRKLMGMGAAVALITVDRRMNWWQSEAAKEERGFRLATRTRTPPLYLELADTLEATLAKLGRRTRRNFRSYRRRAEEDLGAEFVPEVKMGRAHFVEMNGRSTIPMSAAVAGWRYDLLERTGRSETMFAGVRAADGRWLSLIGGRRHGTTTEIDWQMNLNGLPRYSLSTVMRAFLLENEIARGTRRLWFEGGTPHPMRHSFVHGEVTDLLALRRGSLRAWAMQHFARWRFPVRNFLSNTLREMQQGTAERRDPPQDTLDRVA